MKDVDKLKKAYGVKFFDINKRKLIKCLCGVDNWYFNEECQECGKFLGDRIQEDYFNFRIADQNKPKIFTLDNYIENIHHFYYNQPFFYDNVGIFWFWNNYECKYEIKDDTDVMNLLDSVLGFKGQTVSGKTKANYLEAMRRVGRLKTPQNAPKKWVQFKNKAYSLNSGKIYQVKPNYFFTNPIPHEIGVSESTPVIDRLFTEWVGEKYKSDLYELLAYCCYSDYPIQLIFCLYGHGRNGKSQFIKLLNKFIGTDNICSTELDTLIDNRFESFKLYKKLVCSMGETNFGVIKKTSLLKKLVGGDLIGFEKKNKDPFDDVNYAKILIASNSLPSSDDTSDGFMRRWHIIDFPNEFPEGKDIINTIPKIEYNNLAYKVTKIITRLIKHGKFSNQGSIEHRKIKYISVSNPLSMFLDTYCIKDPSSYIEYNYLYTEYVKYLIKHKKRKVKLREFKDALENEGYYIEKTSKKMGDSWTNGRFINGLRENTESRDFCDISDSVSTYKSLYRKVSEINSTKGTNVTKNDVFEDYYYRVLGKIGNEPVETQKIIEMFDNEEIGELLLKNHIQKGTFMENPKGFVQRVI